MKAAWVRPGHPAIPDGEKMKRWGIDTLFYDATDPQISGKFFDELRALHIKVGITRDPSWGSLSAKALASQLAVDLHRLESDNKQCSVITDIEKMWQRGSGYVLEWLTEWRRLKPTRATSWTTEPFQGGTVSDELAARINADPNLLVIPQLYFGPHDDQPDMTPANEAQVAMEMQFTQGRRAIDRSRIKSYYDPRYLPGAWDGIVFDFNKLP